MFQFKNKTVFIISPESWGGMKISKHHYALELANLNCRVFFIEPPKLSNVGVSINTCKDHSLISLVSYKPIFRGKRFFPKFAYSFLIKQQVKILLKKINVKPDVVWCFNGNLFQNLKWFKAPLNIFFAADLFKDNYLPQELNSADIILTVSDSINEKLEKSGIKSFMIGHGLQSEFVCKAKDLIKSENFSTQNTKIVVGYSGNLRMEALDRKTMMKVIKENTEINFIFWGSYQKKDLNLGGLNSVEVDDFIHFLESKENVILRGVVDSRTLQEEMSRTNLFWLCWELGVYDLWDGSNSHKILEYLSTGKPVVSHHVSTYIKTDLLYMMPTKDNKDYSILFKRAVDIVKNGESKEIIEKRIDFAITKAYYNQVVKIENLINENIHFN